VINRLLKLLQEKGLLVSVRNLETFSHWNGGVQTDNRLIRPGDIFVCIKGEKFDGHRFVDTALSSGAALIVCQDKQSGTFPMMQVTDTRKAAALIARELWCFKYSETSETVKSPKPFTLVGVTGTNGKTTTSLMIYEALRNLGFACGWIGTLGYYINGTSYPTNNTTPDIIQLNSIFSEMADHGVCYVVMEVSSHALALDRVYGVDYDYCVFTNLSRDHLDFHGNMDNYAKAKFMLFNNGIESGATAIVNTDDTFGMEICDRLKQVNAVCHSVGTDNADYCIKDIDIDVTHSSFKLVSQTLIVEVASKLIGSFNIQNLSLTAVTLLSMGFAPEAITKAIKEIAPVKGRIEQVENPHNIHVFVDYAHTPDAIENLLKAVLDLPHQRILCLFGAGGERDKGKRPLMLKAALKYSDAVIVTDDNPREESPDAIIRDIVIDCDPRLPWWIIRDRKLAIQSIIHLAQAGDIVLICGKGHEKYQEIAGIKHPFDDLVIAKTELNNRGILSNEKAEDELILPVDSCLLELLFSPYPEKRCVGYRNPKSFRYISSDSRNIKSGSLFFAISGDNFDGNSFVADVLSDPDNCAIARRSNLEPTSINDTAFAYDKRCMYVDNPVQAMALLCRKYLQMFNPQRIAITGSTGKTTTKELIARILEESAPCLRTAKNENNLIGLCKTILRLEPHHRYAVFELGTNHFGEIAELAETIFPDIAIILNIGPSHLEFFGDENGVYKEKIELFKRPLAMRIYPGDDPHFSTFNMDGTSIGFGEHCNHRIVNQKLMKDGQMFTMDEVEWQLPYTAPHFAINTAFAIVLAQFLGLSNTSIQASLLKPVALEMRAQTEQRGSGTLIVDCYNANPSSMQAALEYWQQTDPDKSHYAILGDMLELGNSSLMYHEMIGAMLTEMRFEKLYTVGPFAVNYTGKSDVNTNMEVSIPSDFAFNRYICFKNVDEILNSGVLQNIPDDSVVLIKASHGIHLERLLPALRGDN
jgi:UDP-N-acetylmuramyl-tripeptide synthetase/UDP-N-acetylmuramoyl-tripeptide--D-alanyl-D-alanine ligase